MNNNMTQEHLFSMTRAKLVELAGVYGIEHCQRLNKQTLVEKLLERQLTTVMVGLHEEEAIEKSKYYLGPHITGWSGEDELPDNYGDTKVTVMARDPHWLYAYWEISHQCFEQARQDLQSNLDDCKKVLRVYDITGIIFDGDNANSYFDLTVDGADSWYVEVKDTSRSYCVSVGLLTPEGYFYSLTRSNHVVTSSDAPSDIFCEEWLDGYDQAKSLPVKGYSLVKGSSFAWEQIYQPMTTDIMGCEAASQFSPK